MNKSPLLLSKFKNTVEKILHVPGNFTEPILEMTVIVDANLSYEQVTDYLPDLLLSLKMHSTVFRNVRLNVVYWGSDTEISCKVSPMSLVLLNSYYDDYQQKTQQKTFETLLGYLKLFHARSKLLILLTDGIYRVEHEDMLCEAMQPFLEKKLMEVVLTGEGADIRYRFTRTV